MGPATNGNGEEPTIAWERHADELARVDPSLRPALVASLERDVVLSGAMGHLRTELRGLRAELTDRDAKLFGDIGSILALAKGTAARVARLDNEREVTREQVREVHRWAEDLKRDADASNQGRIVSMKEATEALAARQVAEIGKGIASAQLEVERDARRSLTTETTVIRTERRGRPWQMTTILAAALAGAMFTGGATAGVWWLTRPAPAVQTTQGK